MAKPGRKTLDLTGQRYGRLVVQTLLGMVDGYRCWSCSCDCGSQDVIVQQASLRRGRTRSCGCLRREATRERRLGTGGCFLPAVRRLRRQGLTMQAIGDRLGICRQRVHQLLQQVKDGRR
jgi:hypothetical protein